MATKIILGKFDLALTANSMFEVLMLEWITRRMAVDSVMLVRVKLRRMWQATVWLPHKEVKILPIPLIIRLMLTMPRKALRRLVKDVLGRLLVAVEECMVMVILVFVLSYTAVQVLWTVVLSVVGSGVVSI